MSMYICQHLTDGVGNQQHGQEMAPPDLPELEFMDVDQVRINKIPQIPHICMCCFVNALWCISIYPECKFEPIGVTAEKRSRNIW